MQHGCFGAWSQRRYYRDLKEIVAYCMAHGVVRPFRLFIRNWLNRGAPIDPAALEAPIPSLRIVIRQLCVALNIEAWKADALLWLRQPECRFPPGALNTKHPHFPNGRGQAIEECFIPYNLVAYAPQGTPYHGFNKHGIMVEG